MANQANALRAQRTHKLLQDALVELLEEKHFEHVTVGELTRRAMLNRATFYRHYLDKYDFVEKIFEAAAHALSAAIGPPRVGLDSLDADQPPDAWVAFFEHIAEHTALYRALLGKNGSSRFVLHMRDYMIQVMNEREQLRSRLPGIKRGQEAMPRKVALAFTANLLLSTLAWWLEDEPHYSPREMATWFRRFLFSSYPQALGFGPQHEEKKIQL
ncbi:TetR/AcrR family transcriptional regulator [Ktedonosporobacter rubrisoli]|uniref:TetR/AcrR family transcriptional regulator n=1 Tax=Ktedonosporobacter rubrisoli TaxID=2509675 RepID=A0A4P6JIF3_KTERU|nr:TetR/AcrR family transcriptional regulator [Ktedonosporobacter rubrisoli]QBD74844.1 TetR/AcrR family transcriptional regulator [Ktedonosporobacter rubrisoli]